MIETTLGKKASITTKETGKLSLLSKADLFSKLDEKELGTIARYSGYRTYPEGAVIFEEGSHKEELYLIKKGTVLIRKGENGNTRDIAQFVEGEVFGEMDLLDSSPRTASAVAEGPVTLLVFPKPDVSFTDILDKHPDVFAHVLQKLLGVIAGRIRATDKLVSEKTPWIQELKKQLQRDKLTSLHNRAYLEEELPAILGSRPRTSLIIIKPDNFKIINDTYGHEAGDGALVLIAETMKSRLKEGDIGVRYRGDEYCVVMPGHDEAGAASLARDLLEAMKGMDIGHIIAGNTLRVTASIGIATYPAKAQNAQALVAAAFDAMMEARNAGGDRIHGQETG
jgi:diguanylate cyclase (GGDEF)-like protein